MARQLRYVRSVSFADDYPDLMLLPLLDFLNNGIFRGFRSSPELYQPAPCQPAPLLLHAGVVLDPPRRFFTSGGPELGTFGEPPTRA